MPVDMKLMIASTFARMAQSKQVDKITVKDLVEQCGISRQAFYYHFQDILEVMEWSIWQMIQKALQKSLQAETPQKAIEEFIRVSVEHKDWLRKLLSSQRHIQVEHIFVEAMRSSIRQMICRPESNLSIPYEDLEVALTFCACGTAGAVFECCKNADVNSEQLSQKLYRLLSGNLFQENS